MDQIIAHIKDGRFIEAIKQFRALYGAGLKEAKDACDALRALTGTAHVSAYASETFVVMSRYENEYDWHLQQHTCRADADDRATEICANMGTDEVIVARITSQSTRKLAMVSK
jgi:uncharacterized protein YjlB